MKNKHFLMLMVVMIMGLFSVAYAETIVSLTEAQMNEADAEIAAAAKAAAVAPPKIAVPVPAPVPPALPRKGEMVNWFKGGNADIPVGQAITLVDVWTGKSFKAIRTYGHNHADMEAASMGDMQKMKEIWNGQWSWDRRPMVAMVNGQNYAVSCAGMPHAGLENAATEATVNNRSGGFGRGMNLDKIKGNGMDGHFDLHMLGSKTHGTQRVDSKHQAMIHIASGQ